VTFDNARVGGSAGTTPDTIEPRVRDAIAFIAAMQFSQADLLGFSIALPSARPPRLQAWPDGQRRVADPGALAHAAG